MAAVREIDGTLGGRRWAIASEAGAAGLTHLSIRVWPAARANPATPEAARAVIDRAAAERRS